MQMYDAMFSASYVLNERIAEEVFEVLPECGPLVAIVTRDGHCWPSDAEAFGRLNLSEELLADLQAKVDDGAEPAATQVGDATVTMVQLATEHTNCGYLLLATSRSGPEGPAASWDMTETLASLIGLTAQLIEQDRLLGEVQMKCYGAYHTAHAPAN